MFFARGGVTRRAGGPRRRRSAARIGVEGLEDRQLLSTVVALTEDARLLRFDGDQPGAILAAVPVGGLQAGESLLGLDVRPATGELYGLGSSGRLYVLDPNTGAATLRATLAADPADASDPFTGLSGTAFGIDFNPVADRLRVVSDADVNLRIHPTTGAVFTDDPLAFAATDRNAGVDPIVTDIAYTSNAPTATSTTLLGIEGLDPILHSTKTLPDGTTAPALTIVRQGGAGGTPSPNTGQLASMAPVGRNGAILKGFDIAPSGTALTAFELNFPDGSASTALVRIDPATGVDQALGRIGDGTTAIRDIAVVPSVQFAAQLHAAREDAGTVALAVTRTDGASAPASVEFATANDTAIAGLDYLPVAGRLDFAAGEMTKTIVVPILDDPAAEGDESFRVVLSNPAGGQALLGAPAEAQVRISANDAPDRRGPRVVRILETGPSRGITGFTAQFDEDLDPARAQDVNNYRLFGLGRGGRLTPISLGLAAYDPAQRLVTVTASRPFLQTEFRQLLFRVNGRRNGVTDVVGNRLNSIHGRFGGDATFRFAVFSGTTVSFRDTDGDVAVLSITNGGRLDGIRPLQAPGAQRTQFWILDPIPLRSTLSGTVRTRGDGIVVIAEIIGLDKKEFAPLLNNTAFRVNTLTFSSNATGIG